jgi:hypothetical protein
VTDDDTATPPPNGAAPDPSTAVGALRTLGLPVPDASGAIRVTNRVPADAAEGPPVTIEGTDLQGKPWELTLRTIGAMPVGVEADASYCMGVKEGQMVYRRDPILRTLGSLVHPDDRQAWLELLHDTNRMVQLTTLGDVLMSLVAVLSDRPTGPLLT